MKLNELSVENVDAVVKACFALHNFVLEEYNGPFNNRALADTGLGVDENGLWRGYRQPLHQAENIRQRGANTASEKAKANRETLADYFSDEGQIEWQDNYA